MHRVGVLSLQGDFARHRASLEALGVEACPVRLPEDLERDGQAVLALPANPLVVEPFDGVVERPRRLAAASWGEQRVKDGLGPVSAQGDWVGGVLD